MYADKVTDSMKFAIEEVDRRRAIQVAYNEKHGITPQQIVKPIREKLIAEELETQFETASGKKVDIDVDYQQLPPKELHKEIKKLEQLMRYEAEMLNFEKAAALRDKIKEMKTFGQKA
jgi:excinuclease ABC subunit B